MFDNNAEIHLRTGVDFLSQPFRSFRLTDTLLFYGTRRRVICDRDICADIMFGWNVWLLFSSNSTPQKVKIPFCYAAILLLRWFF